MSKPSKSVRVRTNKLTCDHHYHLVLKMTSLDEKILAVKSSIEKVEKDIDKVNAKIDQVEQDIRNCNNPAEKERLSAKEAQLRAEKERLHDKDLFLLHAKYPPTGNVSDVLDG